MASVQGFVELNTAITSSTSTIAGAISAQSFDQQRTAFQEQLATEKKKKYCCETSLNLDYPSNAMHVLLY
ncbi:hypothetical protein vBSenS3_179 [Salmonella phage vB_SenS-3]|nr:hypothetical protein vBSenS3_179 [Salmonella phage vB_SenS-3]